MTKSISVTSTRIVIVATILAFALLAFTSTAFAGKPNGPAAVNGLAHPGAVNQLELYEKDANWDPVVGGANGRVTFGEEGFVFNGHGLVAGESYILINYVDPWPGTPATCLASGTANGGGNLNLSGTNDLNGLGKIWLVLNSDVNCGVGMTGWNPASYLFEYNTI